MTDTVSPPSVDIKTFATRARTIDHLGREQIADCPTAISELWKNAWDAYARNVRLRIFDEETPVAVLTDDGHGMSQTDLFERWLIIGTESKISDLRPTSAQDRQGLKVRARQGQKGIGRLSSAKLGSVLLLITKYRNDPYVVALIDWRMFENPFLNLSDVAIAAGTFENKNEIFLSLPAFAETLTNSVMDREGEPNSIRQEWKRYDETWSNELPIRTSLPPSKKIIQSMKRLPFRSDHLSDWEGPGTAMLVFELDDTLRALPSRGDSSMVNDEISDRFEKTLSNFVDPYAAGIEQPKFSYRADVRTTEENGAQTRVIVGAEKTIDRTQVKEMEHQLEGTVGEDGIFRGRIKAFGNWIEGSVEFELPRELSMPDRANARVGSFEIFIASMEFELDNSTHPRSEHSRYKDLAEHYSGLMIYRDGLRVLPYGRPDNDFFEIEYKRSKNAGRYFWNHRQMFGRIALKREANPNLKDKAGREGFIDNTAAKTFRALVGNILDLSARRYFGSASDIRKPRITEINAKNRAGKAEEEAKKLRERERKQFQRELEIAETRLPELHEQIVKELGALTITRDADVSRLASNLSRWRNVIAETPLRPQPSGTARLKPRYLAAQAHVDEVSEAISKYEVKLRQEVARYSAAKPEQILADQIKDSLSAVRDQIEKYQTQIEDLQREQYDEVRLLASQRVIDFKQEAEAIQARFSSGRSDFSEVFETLASLQNDWMDENRSFFGLYVSALETVREQIDLETLASVQVQDLREAAVELDRLTALAQLGIAVEIAAHDLADFDEMATTGLNALPKEMRDSEAVRDIRLGLEGLTDQLRFLSPLRLSGDKIQRWIEGAEIENFVERFFAPTLTRAGINFETTTAFREFRLYERPARVFPVFVNLINNSIYWVGTMPRSTRHIILDVVGEEIVVSDSGPGVAEEDIDQIFKLFFTRKQRSGRGVGLYLVRANLSAGGHTIRYKTKDDDVPLSGAAFLIKFQGVDFKEMAAE
ncbi:ATP-binding protein [Roseibium sp. FZY0029]|uniref:ATP-binding protein n=1 Tax=Roseibium sp. FZY0029 TaxID=3116647 RepID=UPI002EC7EF63|nr:ATP-binding protein [Roseibium sp. FZY0029]